jgi:hypothetical protein
MKTQINITTVILIVVAVSSPVQALIVDQGYWRLGEADSGAIAGNQIPDYPSSTADSAGSNVLYQGQGGSNGRVFYSSNVASGSVNPTGSTLSASFTASGGGTSPHLVQFPAHTYDFTDNFGVELWVNSALSTQTVVLANNGSVSNLGWGIIQYNSDYAAVYNGVTVFGNSVVSVGIWTHLALVRDGGLTTFYVNGISNATTSSAFNVTNNGDSFTTTFSLGAAGGAAFPFTGNLDEVRVFTFAPGGFNVSDLNVIAVPEPSTYVLMVLGLLSLLFLRKMSIR